MQLSFSVTVSTFSVPKPVSSGPPKPPQSRPTPAHFSRKAGHLIPDNRVYKPKTSRGHGRGRRGAPSNRNMTLNNNRRPYQSVWSLDARTVNNLIQFNRSRRVSSKRLKYSEKPCPRFTTTGAPVLPSQDTITRFMGGPILRSLFTTFLSSLFYVL